MFLSPMSIKFHAPECRQRKEVEDKELFFMFIDLIGFVALESSSGFTNIFLLSATSF